MNRFKPALNACVPHGGDWREHHGHFWWNYDLKTHAAASDGSSTVDTASSYVSLMLITCTTKLAKKPLCHVSPIQGRLESISEQGGVKPWVSDPVIQIRW
jgi:hypothetical protein